MLELSWRVIASKGARLFVTVAVMASLSFVSLAQVGMMIGWMSTIAGIINHAGVDL